MGRSTSAASAVVDGEAGGVISIRRAPRKRRQIIDQGGVDMESGYAVEESAEASASPALPLIYEGINELMQEGLATWHGLSIPVSAGDRVLYAVSLADGDIVGVLCYAWRADAKVAEITLGYVEPSSRRQHVFTKLWDALLYRASQTQFSVVAGGVHAANNVAQSVFRNLRCTAKAVAYEHRPN